MLLEIAEDLEALVAHYRGAGDGEEEAARRAEEKLIADPEAVRHLMLVHSTPMQRFLHQFGSGARVGFDAVLFCAAILPMVAFGLAALTADGLVVHSSPVTWLLFGGLIAAVSIGLSKSSFLLSRRGWPDRRARRGVGVLLLIAAGAPVIGLIAFTSGLLGIARDLQSAGATLSTTMGSLAAAASTLTLALIVAMGAALITYIVESRAGSIERRESAVLLGDA